MSKRNLLLVPLTVLLGGLSLASTLQLPRTVHSQQDYEELIITETNNEQRLNQKNIGSGSSSNLNCGTNVIESTSTSATCPTIPGETPTAGMVIPVVTQRVANISTIPSGITSGEAQCNLDEVVTGGGYDIPKSIRVPTPSTVVLREFATDNAWHVEVSDVGVFAPMKIFAECLKLVPA